MFYVHKNNGQEIKEKVSFSDNSLIRDSLCSNHTLSIYKAMTETQKELVDKYLNENYPNGLDDLGLEEFMKFEVEQLLKSKGAKEIYVCATHPVFSGPALDRLGSAPITQCIVTNTIPLDTSKLPSNIKQISVAPLLAQAISRIHDDESVSSLFGFEKEMQVS